MIPNYKYFPNFQRGVKLQPATIEHPGTAGQCGTHHSLRACGASHTPVSRPLKKWWFLGTEILEKYLGIQEILSGYVKIAIENDHWNSGFSHSSWWFSIAMLNYQRVSTRKPKSWSFRIIFPLLFLCPWIADDVFFPPSGQPTRNADSTENIFFNEKRYLEQIQVLGKLLDKLWEIMGQHGI